MTANPLRSARNSGSRGRGFRDERSSPSAVFAVHPLISTPTERTPSPSQQTHADTGRLPRPAGRCRGSSCQLARDDVRPGGQSSRDRLAASARTRARSCATKVIVFVPVTRHGCRRGLERHSVDCCTTLRLDGARPSNMRGVSCANGARRGERRDGCTFIVCKLRRATGPTGREAFQCSTACKHPSHVQMTRYTRAAPWGARCGQLRRTVVRDGAWWHVVARGGAWWRVVARGGRAVAHGGARWRAATRRKSACDKRAMTCADARSACSYSAYARMSRAM